MAKINKYEYEILKGLDDEWNWIARDNIGVLGLFMKKPKKYKLFLKLWSDNISPPRYIDDAKFQFIQWEDEKPYNIQELIDEYEGYVYTAEHFSNVMRKLAKALGDSWNESEETEVKKDIEWLKREVNDNGISAMNLDDKELVIELDMVNGLLNQLDEPEVLSQEWIDKNSALGQFATSKVINFDKFVKADKLQNLLVPKQPFGNSEELPKIPQWVADNIESKKRVGTRLNVAMSEFPEFKLQKELDIDEHECNEIYARAWIDGYTVEEEQKYQVIIRDGEYMRLYLCKHDGNVTIGTNDNYIEKCPEVTYLTEQEIKDYDERFWAFAKPVEELE